MNIDYMKQQIPGCKQYRIDISEENGIRDITCSVINDEFVSFKAKRRYACLEIELAVFDIENLFFEKLIYQLKQAIYKFKGDYE